MVIDEMTEQECNAFLERAKLGRLGCSLNDQPYVVPIYVAFEPRHIYALSTFGQKIEWMRTNPKVCVEIDEIVGEAEWRSVLVKGRYEELHEPQFTEERDHARDLLERRHRWWQTAFAERQLRSTDQLVDPIIFRIEIVSVTGLRAHP
ncbi:MAG: pyridoxamine 5'-phosphate oxidase family protein [Acidobacteriaceae bacterium]